MAEIKWSDRIYFGSRIKPNGTERIVLYWQYGIGEKGRFEWLGLGTEKKVGDDKWSFRGMRSVTFPPSMITEVQKLINSIKQDDVIRQIAEHPTEVKKDDKDPF